VSSINVSLLRYRFVARTLTYFITSVIVFDMKSSPHHQTDIPNLMPVFRCLGRFKGRNPFS